MESISWYTLDFIYLVMYILSYSEYVAMSFEIFKWCDIIYSLKKKKKKKIWPWRNDSFAYQLKWFLSEMGEYENFSLLEIWRVKEINVYYCSLGQSDCELIQILGRIYS
jgi:hypothetical protein